MKMICRRCTKNLLKVIVAGILCLLPAVLMAEDTPGSKYIIKKGDTLWDISSARLKDPFLWKELWKMNPYVKNPDLIYPGQQLTIPGELTKQKEEGTGNEEEAAHRTAEMIVPDILHGKQAQTLTLRYLVSKRLLLTSGYISENIPASTGKIADSPQKRGLNGRGDYVYIESKNPIPAKTKFYILRKPEEIIHPLTNKRVGYLVRVKGIIETEGEENGYVKALILDSYEEVLTGDLVSDYYVPDLPLEPVKARKPSIQGVIIKVNDGNDAIGSRSIAYLDKGTADGVSIGDLFEVTSGAKPHVPLGTVQIISSSQRASVALVTKASMEIVVGDTFGN